MALKTLVGSAETTAVRNRPSRRLSLVTLVLVGLSVLAWAARFVLGGAPTWLRLGWTAFLAAALVTELTARWLAHAGR